jgi:hypothetical protein
MYRSFEHYISSCIEIARERLSGFASMAEIAAHEKEINRYPRLDQLSLPRQIHILRPGGQNDALLSRAKAYVSRGEILFEHAAAGEGTRLMLGPKYFLNVAREFTMDKIAHYISRETGEVFEPDKIVTQLDCLPQELLPHSLGTRHMLQLSFDLTKLSHELGEPPKDLLARQHLLIIISKEMLAHIERDFYEWHFFGFNPNQVFFMVQKSFHGLNLKGGQFFYDTQSPRRLHNHGQMVIQQTMDRQIFNLAGGQARDKVFFSQESVAHWLQNFADKISYNIEDLDYLTGSLDFDGLGLALELGDKGCNMIMEVVSNNPLNPQKGGMLAWDDVLQRDVMIESFQLEGLDHKDIKYLNRNFNHYPQPWVSWRRVGEMGLPMPIAVKDGYLYFQPVQGDINFLVKTAFFRRPEMQAIRNLKAPSQLPLAINCMFAQDNQEGFRKFVQNCHQGNFDMNNGCQDFN